MSDNIVSPNLKIRIKYEDDKVITIHTTHKITKLDTHLIKMQN